MARPKKQPSPVPDDPQGIGGHKYIARMEEKIYRALESLIDEYMGEDDGKDGRKTDARYGAQVTNAIKTLAGMIEKDRQSAVETMDAYQEQLVSLASFIVTQFLPMVGKTVRRDIRTIAKGVMAEVEAHGKDDPEMVEVWGQAVERMSRQFGFKRFELIFARALSQDKACQDAFLLSEDLVDTFKAERRVEFDSTGSIRIREAITKREIKKQVRKTGRKT